MSWGKIWVLFHSPPQILRFSNFLIVFIEILILTAAKLRCNERKTPCLYKIVPYKTVQYKTVRKNMKIIKKTVRYKTVRKTVLINNCLNKPQAENFPLFNKHNEQNSDHRIRANVLRACQQRVGLNTKFRAGYRAPTGDLKLDCFVLDCFFPPLHDFWD